MLEQIKETTEFIKAKTNFSPEFGIILGTGLGGLVNDIEIEHTLEYSEIPNFPVSTVEGHSGRLIFGKLGERKVVAMQGRFHYYEGYEMTKVVFPVRVLKYLGIQALVISNASGGVNPDFEIGDLMIIDDHINLIPNPLVGKHYPEFGARFPDMSETYSLDLIAKAEAIAADKGIKVQKGVYTGVTGPTLETPAEYKYFRIIGSDAVGMSTVPEVIVAHQMEVPCFAVSIITDLGVPGKIVKVTHEDVQAVAAKQEVNMTYIIKELLRDL